jgi:hypothetical protein
MASSSRWGRRKILLLGAAAMSISQLIVGTLYAVYRNRWETNVGAGWAAAIFIWVYIANFSYSIGKQFLGFASMYLAYGLIRLCQLDYALGDLSSWCSFQGCEYRYCDQLVDECKFRKHLSRGISITFLSLSSL